MEPAACPDENELVRFARGALDEPAGASVASHLDACGSCRRAVAEAASDVPLTPPLAGGARVGRYVIESLLGAGAMGAVFAAHDTALARRVAIKLLHASGDEASQARLEREAQAMARLNHPHVVTVFDLGEWTGGRYIAMELVDGQTLDVWLRDKPPAQRRRALLGAGEGLAEAHRAGVVHRDFKPGNLLVGPEGRARVTDFGLARPLVAPDAASGTGNLLATQHGALVGTPAWMSPEQLDGRVADARSDQFAFCVVYVEALTGRRPFLGAGSDHDALRAAMRRAPVLERPLTSHERRVLARGLSENPGERFPSMDALLDALAHPPRRWPYLVALAVLLVVGGLGARAWSRRPVEEPAVEVAVGQMRSLDFACISRVAIGDSEIADLKTLGDGELLLLGGKAGQTTLIVWDCDERRHTTAVRVTPAP